MHVGSRLDSSQFSFCNGSGGGGGGGGESSMRDDEDGVDTLSTTTEEEDNIHAAVAKEDWFQVSFSDHRLIDELID